MQVARPDEEHNDTHNQLRISPVSPTTARSNSSTLSFAGTDQRNLDRDEAMNKLGEVNKNDKKNMPLDVRLN